VDVRVHVMLQLQIQPVPSPEVRVFARAVQLSYVLSQEELHTNGILEQPRNVLPQQVQVLIALRFVSMVVLLHAAKRLLPVQSVVQ
jgi:hypothetical protein